MTRRIVIIGGMGPQASLELHRRLLKAASEHGSAKNDDYPEILHVSLPVPDFISSDNRQAGLERIRQSLRDIKFREDDRVVLACNTAHVLLPEIEDICSAKLISLIDVAAEAASKRKVKCVGVLASPTTFRLGLYEKPLRQRDIRMIAPNNEDMARVERAIREVIANRPVEAYVRELAPVLVSMRRAGAEAIILGCTELSTIFSQSPDRILIDPLNEVIKQLIKI